MGLFDKLRGKGKETKASTKSSIQNEDPLQVMAKGVLAIEKVAKEHYLPQIEQQISNPAAAQVLKNAFNLGSDNELKAFLLLKVMERDFGKADPGNVGVITALKDLFGFDMAKAIDIIKKAGAASLNV